MMTVRSIEQLLQVFELVRDNCRRGKHLQSSYHDAVRSVAKKHSVTYQTIGDGCRRRLNLDNVNELYHMLTAWLNGDGRKLKQQVLQCSELAAHDLIERFFSEANNPTDPSAESRIHSTEEFEALEIRVRKQEVRLVRALAELEGLSVEELLSQLISQNVRTRMKTVAKDFISDLP